MAHVALIITGLRGKLNASFEIASRLRAEGHEVTYICPQNVRAEIEAIGFRFVKVPEVNFDGIDPDAIDLHISFKNRFRYHLENWGSHYEIGKKLLNLEKYKDVLKDLNPARVLVDMEMHDFIFTAISLKIPITLFTTWFSDRICAELPPIRTNIIPGKGFKGSKLGIVGAWIYLRTRFWIKYLLDYICLKHYRRFVLKRYAKEIGFDTSELLPNNFPPLFSYTKLPIVTMAMKELDFPHEFPENWAYGGSMVYEKRAVDLDEKASVRIKKIISDKIHTGAKLIYCSVSTFSSGDMNFLQKVIEAVEDKPSWSLIISLGGGSNINDFRPTPENVHLFEFVPQLEVLKNADCSINHAGINSINECIHFKVPMLVYSGKKYDQNGCAARIAYHNLGIIGDKDAETVYEINLKIRRILSDSRYKSNLTKFKRYYEEYRAQKISPLIFRK